ncbi:MAG: AAA family ATPase, partial [Actinomycetaceae bacterium]|nr:AAA family ATPase [Actinomycetaceae bacterium]
VTPHVEQLLEVLGDEEKSRAELLIELKLSDRKNLREKYLKPAISAGLIELTIPDKPKSRLQKYRRTTTS